MEFEIVFYKDENGNSPVEEFILRLIKTNRELFNKTSSGIEKLKYKVYHSEPISKYLEPGLFELRIKARTDILRLIYTFQKGRVIILLHVFIKKQQKTPANELEMARKRLNEIKMREKN
jgi:phage-related protein